VKPDPGGPDAPVVNAMSIDVEDYFHVSVFDGYIDRSAWTMMESRVEANTERILALFDEFGVRSTFFVLAWVAERYPGLVRRIATAGHEIASHGYAHQLIYRQTRDVFRDDVRRARAILQEVSGQAVAGYRAPSYSVTAASLWALEVLAEEGYGYDASVFPIRHDRYGIPGAPRHPHRWSGQDATLLEVPASTVRVAGANLPVAGGGYFRIFPYAWTKWGIGRLNRVEGRPAVFYLHPWEIDPGQPRLRTSAVGRFRHYRNLRKTEGRLRRLLTDFRFGTIGDLLTHVTPETVAYAGLVGTPSRQPA